MKSMKPTVVQTVNTTLQAEQLCALLEDNGIVTDRRELGTGGVTQAYCGFSHFGTEILVDEADAPHAKALLQDFLAQSEAPVDDQTLEQLAMQGVSEEELTRQAMEAAPQQVTDNAAFRAAQRIAIVLAVLAVVFWLGGQLFH